MTFWNEPFFRWIAGTLHMLFGDSSVGQAYWDAAGITIMALFAFRMLAPTAGFAWGVAVAILPLSMFLLGPTLEFVGFSCRKFRRRRSSTWRRFSRCAAASAISSRLASW